MKRNPSRRRILRQQQRRRHRTEARHKVLVVVHISTITIVVHAIMMLMMIEPCCCHGRRHPSASTFTRHLSPRLTEHHHHHHHHESRRRSTTGSTFIPAWITSNSLTASSSAAAAAAVRRTRTRTRQTFSPVLNHERRRIFPAATVATASTLTRQGMTTRLSSSSSSSSGAASRMFSSTMTNNETSRQTTSAMQDSSLGKARDNDNDVTALLNPPKHMNINHDTDATIDDWKSLPALNPTIHFKSWIIPTVHALNRILNAKEIQPYLATRLELLQHLQNRHCRFRVIMNVPDDGPITHKQQDATTTTHKLVLLHPDTPTAIDDLDDSVQNLLTHECITIIPGPIIPITFTYQDFTAHYALSQVLPQHLHPVPSAFETIGHVAHLNLKSIHLPYKQIIGQILLELIRPKVHVVMCKRGEVSGPFRTYDFDILASSSIKSTAVTETATTVSTSTLPRLLFKDGKAAAVTAHDDDVDNNNDNDEFMTMVNVTEWGITCCFNVRNVYWSSRLSTERQRLCLEELFVHHHGNELFIADAFCGVGALCLQAMKHYKNYNSNSKKSNIVVWANDWNPAATASLQDNAKHNGIMSILQDPTTATSTATSSLSNNDRLVIRCGDAYEFLMDLGIQATRRDDDAHNENNNSNVVTTSPSQKRPTPRRLPDHVIMNYPLEAPTFLGALRWWPVAVAAPLKKKKTKPGRRIGKNGKNNSSMVYNNDTNKAAARDDNDDNVVIPRVHVYTFARADPDTHRSAEQVAVDLIAQNLIPGMGIALPLRQHQEQRQDNHVNNDDHQSDVSTIDEDNVDDTHQIHCFKTTTTSTTQDKLDQEYNANVKIHAVRDVAPGKVVYCVSFSVTPRLLRHMQGDFDD